jgi:nicotinamidase-related amidase
LGPSHGAVDPTARPASTVIGVVDRGYRVILAADAVCSTSDATHDALLHLCRSRFSQQIEVASVDQILDAWR